MVGKGKVWVQVKFAIMKNSAAHIGDHTEDGQILRDLLT